MDFYITGSVLFLDHKVKRHNCTICHLSQRFSLLVPAIWYPYKLLSFHTALAAKREHSVVTGWDM